MKIFFIVSSGVFGVSVLRLLFLANSWVFTVKELAKIVPNGELPLSDQYGSWGVAKVKRLAKKYSPDLDRRFRELTKSILISFGVFFVSGVFAMLFFGSW